MAASVRDGDEDDAFDAGLGFPEEGLDQGGAVLVAQD